MIPNELKQMPRWVTAKNGQKLPLQADKNKVALLNDPGTWTVYSVAKQAVMDGHRDYVGFVFYGDGIVGIDLDDVFDEMGMIQPKAIEIINTCKSYTEVSKSGTGIHILVKGQLPFKGRNNRDGVEIYQTGRYFIITENELVYGDVIPNQKGIDDIVDKHFPQMRETTSTGISPRLYSPVWEMRSDGRINVEPTYPPITQGSRNDCLASLAGSLHNDGYTDGQIYDTLCRVNESAVHPPVSDRELVTIVQSITRYKR